ncbi:MAG TPA: hypothetical protein VJO34_07885 [Methylomirabilota bacterium]|nr:hypothetical protein [Methylomirabilota bacterium]
MRWWSWLRGRPILTAVCALFLLVVAVSGAVAVYVFGDQWRTARLLSEYVSREFGVRVKIDRVVSEGNGRLRLLGIRLPPSEAWGGALSIREIRVDGGLMPFVFPRGRHLSVQLLSTTVTLADRAEPMAAPTADAIRQLRAMIRDFLSWPLTLHLELHGGELRSGPEKLTFDLTGDKQADGQARFTLSFGSQKEPFVIHVGSQTEGEVVVLALEMDGAPSALHPFWPSHIPRPERVNARAIVRVSDSPLVEARGQFSAAPAGRSEITGKLAFSYRADSGRLTVDGLQIMWEPQLALAAKGSLEEIGLSSRLTVNLTGHVGGNRVEGLLQGRADNRSFNAAFTVTPFAVEPWRSLFGFTQPASEYLIDAERVEGNVDLAIAPDWSVGRAQLAARMYSFAARMHTRPEEGAKGAMLSVEATASPSSPNGTRVIETNLRAPRIESGVMGFPATLGVTGQARLRLQEFAFDLLERAALSFTAPSGEMVAQFTARPARTSAHALAVTLTVPALEPLQKIFPGWRASLRGNASIDGVYDWRGAGPRFKGDLSLELPQGQLERPEISVTQASVRLPIRYGADPEAASGNLLVSQLRSGGVVVDDLRAVIRFVDGKLTLPNMTYSHYGGRGEGWLEAELSRTGLSAQFRLDGRQIDLSRLVSGYQMSGASVTGTASYLIAGRREASGKVEAGGRLTVPEPGGKVNIEMLKKLLSYAEADPSGVLRTTLENLSEFPYKSLTAEARTVEQEVRISLSLLGKERFGIFPPKVKAINIQNLPLSFLTRVVSTTTDQGR